MMAKICFLFLVCVIATASHAATNISDVQPIRACSADQYNSSCISLIPNLDKQSSTFQPPEFNSIARNFTFTHTQGLITTTQLLPTSDQTCYDNNENSPIDDNILTLMPQLEKVTTLLSSIGTTCKQVLSASPNANSGFYELLLPNGSFSSVYCDMEGTKCDGQGGWMRVAHFDMTQPNAECPSVFEYHQYSNIGHPLCRRPAGSSAGCLSVIYNTFGYNYTAVCGQAKAYQFNSPDGFIAGVNIEGVYVDGLSITYGSPRSHIWSYACGLEQQRFYGAISTVCPCNQGLVESAPVFVGNDYYCESSLPIGQGWQHVLYANDVLWDGQDCLSQEVSCCLVSKMPWFLKALGGNVNENIELRSCGDQSAWDEDTPIEVVEIYIK